MSIRAAEDFAKQWTRPFAAAVRRVADGTGNVTAAAASGMSGVYADNAQSLVAAAGGSAKVTDLISAGYDAAFQAAKTASGTGSLTLTKGTQLPPDLVGDFLLLRSGSLSGRSLARVLASLAKGLTYPSEEDWGYQGCSAKLDRRTPLTIDSFRAAFKIGPKTTIEQRSFDDLFHYEEDTGPDVGMSPENAAKYQKLEKAMRGVLSDLTVFDIGNHPRHHAYVVGRAPSGDIVGLKALSIET